MAFLDHAQHVIRVLRPPTAGQQLDFGEASIAGILCHAADGGDVNHAIETLMQIKADQPYYIQAREKLAEVYLKHRHDKKLYIKTYKELVDRDPKPESLVILGDAYMSIMEVSEL